MFRLTSTLLLMYVVLVLATLMTASPLLYEYKLVNFSGMSVEVPVLIDTMSLAFSLAVTLISGLVVIFSSHYMSHDKTPLRFIVLLNLFILSMNCLIFIPNLFILLLGWDGLGLTSFILVIYYQNSKSLAAGMITIMTNRLGDVAILVALASSQGWSPMLIISPPAMALLLAGMTKSAQLPFSSWLPAAMAAPTPISALVHSSTLVTAGIYFFIRLAAPLLESSLFTSTLLVSSSLTSMTAGLAAIYEYDLKKIIAFSTLSQLGFMMVSLSLGATLFAYLHLLVHAIFKATLFVCSGNFMHTSTGAQDLRFMSKLTRSPLSLNTFCTSKMALCAAPFMAGFYSKDLILETALASHSNFLVSVTLVMSAILTGTYTARALKHLLKHSKVTPKTQVSMAASSNSSAWGLGSLSVICGYTVLLLTFDKTQLLPYSIFLLPLIAGLTITTSSLSMVFPAMAFTAQLTSQPLVSSLSSAPTIYTMTWLELVGPTLALSHTTRRQMAITQSSYKTLAAIGVTAVVLALL